MKIEKGGKLMYKFLSFVLIAVLLTGCITLGDKKIGNKKSWKYTNELEQNISTKGAVLALLGPADEIIQGNDGGEIYIYKYIKQSEGKIGFFWDLKGSSQTMDSLMCFLSSQGILTDCMIKLEGKKAKSIFK